MAINPLVNYQQVLSMALEDRSNGYQDLVSNVIPLLGLTSVDTRCDPPSGRC